MLNKTLNKFLVTGILVCSWMILLSQENDWTQVYGEDRHNAVFELLETYDNGYLLSGQIMGDGSTPQYGILIKTDINGNVLWEKKVGANPPPGQSAALFAKQTFDGGYIITGTTFIYDNYYDAFVLKLNACGEKEWSRIFYNMGSTEYGVDVEIMDDGTYLTMIKYWGDDLANERIWLFNIDQQGEIIWQKVYAKWTLGTNNEEGYHLIKNNDNEFLITGKYFQYNPGEDTNHRWKRPMFIQIDSLGNEQWHLLWGVNEYYYGWESKSVFNSNGDIYGVGKNESLDINGDKPVLHKVSENGFQQYYKNVVEDSKAGGATTVSILEDSILFIGATWEDFNEDVHNGILKIDTLGNIIKQRDLLNTENAFYSSIVTHDNKYLVTGSFYVDGNWDIYLWKFNKDLEYDSIYTQPLTYDSLCPYEIVSDTIDLDTVTVNLQELYKQMHRIKVQPNPASIKLVVTLGDLAKGTELKLYNTSGQVVKHIPVHPYKREYGIDVSELPGGLYVVTLLNNGKVVDKKKVMVSR